VRWLGYGKSYDRWLTPEYLSDIPHIVEAYQRTHDLSQHGVQPPLLLQPPVLALPAPQAETQGRRHFRSRTTTPAEPPAPPPTPPTLVAPAPPPALADAAPPSPVPLLMPADLTESALPLSPPSLPQTDAVPYPVKDEDLPPEDSDLPFEAKLVNGKWLCGVRKPTHAKQGYVVRWYPAKHFLSLELESEHFELLRRCLPCQKGWKLPKIAGRLRWSERHGEADSGDHARPNNCWAISVSFFFSSISVSLALASKRRTWSMRTYWNSM